MDRSSNTGFNRHYSILLELVKDISSKISLCDSETRDKWNAIEERYFGNPTKKLVSNNIGFGFNASLIDGPELCLFELAGLFLVDEVYDHIWDTINWRDLLGLCSSVEIQELEEFEGGPGMSDTYYWCAVSNPMTFARELRIEILSIIVKGSSA